MLTFIPEFALSKSGMSFLRSVIDGLSTEPTVTVVVPAPPPPPPAPPEQAPATSATASPRMIGRRWLLRDPNFLSLMQCHLFLSRLNTGKARWNDNVVKRQRCLI